MKENMRRKVEHTSASFLVMIWNSGY